MSVAINYCSRATCLRRGPFRDDVGVRLTAAIARGAGKPRRVEPAKRPNRRAAHKRRRIIQQSFGLVRKAFVSGITDRDQNIADEAGAADTFDRALDEQCAERRVIEPRQVGEARRAQFLSRRELHLATGNRKFVPRTYRQTIVATIDAIADRRAQLTRNGALMLDREIGDAAPGIETIRRGEGGRRADIEAGAAIAAMILLRHVLRQFKRRENGAEEEPRAELARHQIGMLALPADARRGGKRLFHHGRGIEEHLDVAAGFLDQPAPETLQPRLDHVVIIVTARVNGNATVRAPFQNRQRIVLWAFWRPRIDAHAYD